MVDYYNCKMSGSEEEFESQPQPGMTKAELRRSNKPIMEKRRRQRINQCLDELKTLILDALKKDPSRHSKLEKADILEMTVKHLRTVQDQHLSTAVSTDPVVLTKFRTGFSECASEVSRFVRHLENVDPVVKQRLVSHLNHCVNNLQQMAPFYSHYVPFMPERLYPEVKVGFQSDFQNGDENNNGSARIQIPNGVQLIPSRLPTGELALLVPQSAGISANFPFFPPAPEPSSRIRQPSAFSTVNRPHSPLLSPSTSTSSYGEESHYSEQYAHAHSPNSQQQRPFKVPEQSPASSKSFSSSSPETQKPQISSSSDSKSPTTTFLEPKSEFSIGSSKEAGMDDSTDTVCHDSGTQSLRQPLSVITDKTYNRASSGPVKKESLKRHHSDGLLVISEKRARFHELTSSSTSANPSSTVTSFTAEDRGGASNDSAGGPSSSNGRSSNPQSATVGPSAAGSSAPNGDMWRPW